MKNKAGSTAVLMASGGMDSTVLAFWLIRKQIDFTPLFIDYGQHSRRTELAALRRALPRKFSGKIAVVRLTTIYAGSYSRLIQAPNLWRDKIKDEDLHLPYRNLLLLAAGAAFAENKAIRNLYAGFIETHRAPGSDCCDSFFTGFDRLLSATGKVQLKLPFKRMSKAQVAQLGIKVSAPIGQTYSCLAAPRIPCGACPNCVDRLNAIASLP